jgi:predicted ATPase
VLILDNCEHIIDAVARLVERLRDEAPDTTILVTSREPLRARGERVLWLTPLACPPESAATPELLSHAAMALFLQRATAGNMGLSLTSQDLHLIADMCRRLGGLPLPIELAAVRVATYGVTATHRLLGEHISLFWAGRRTAPPAIRPCSARWTGAMPCSRARSG